MSGSAGRSDKGEHATRDSLPGLALYMDHLELALAQRGRDATNVGVIALQLDDHTLIGDALGEAALDQTLSEVACRLGAAVRPGDTAARLSRDCFGAICPGVNDARDLLAIVERVQATVSRGIDVGGRQLFPTISVGMTLALGGETAPTLVRDAQAALGEARRAGPGGCHLFDPALRARLLERLEIEHGLRSALQRGELRVYYQPQFDTASGRVRAVEALVRWQHPERGLLEPADFIGVAERSGLIVPLGAWVLGQACRQAVEWSATENADFDLAVNVSARQLDQPDFVQTVADALEHSGLEPSRLCLELTETALMSRPESALAVLSAVRSLGVKVAIDDFGVGFSSLGQLRNLLPIHQLKVDRSFISRIADDPDTRGIVAAVVLMATTLGLEAVAEGVESIEQLAELNALGCGVSQGFLLARPQAPNTIPALLRAGTALPVGELP